MRLHRRTVVVGIAVVFTFVVAPLGAQQNPFFGDDTSNDTEASQSDPSDNRNDTETGLAPAPGDAAQNDRATAREPGLLSNAYARAFGTVVRAQRRLNRELSGLILDSAEDGSILDWVPVLALAFIYGILHAVLPGHRKTILISYYIAEPARVWHGVVVGFAFSVMHVVSAAVIVFTALGAVQMAIGGAVSDMTRSVQAASSWLIIAIGVFYLVAKIRGWLLERDERESARMRDLLSISDNESFDTHISRSRPQSIWPAILAAGIVPCPVTTSVLLFSISIGALGAGIASVIALSAGLGVALALISVMTIVLKEGILRVFERRGGLAITRAIELAGVAAIIFFGVITLSLGIAV